MAQAIPPPPQIEGCLNILHVHVAQSAPVYMYLAPPPILESFLHCMYCVKKQKFGHNFFLFTYMYMYS